MTQLLRVLIVEDIESDAAQTIRQLERAGHEVEWERVETADDMRDALRRRVWDVVISDYHMPQFNAPAALAVVRKASLDIPFIVVSGAIGEETAVKMMRLGAQDYLMKDNLSRLVPAVVREIGRAPAQLSSFAEELDGELLMTCFDGKVYRIVRRGAAR